MPRRRVLIRTTMALLLTVGALSAVMGCARTDLPSEPELSSAAETTASVAATGSASVATTAPADPSADDGSGASASGSSDGAESALSPQDASTLDAELSAIQSELDRLSVPGDEDFDSIGDGLK